MSNMTTKPKRIHSTRLLWPKEGEVVLTCPHADGVNGVEVFAMTKNPRYQRPDGTRGRARFFVLCRLCIDMGKSAKTPLEQLATREGKWQPPPPVEIPVPSDIGVKLKPGG